MDDYNNDPNNRHEENFELFIDYKRLFSLVIINLVHCICIIKMESIHSIFVSVIVMISIYIIEHSMINEILVQEKNSLLKKLKRK